MRKICVCNTFNLRTVPDDDPKWSKHIEVEVLVFYLLQLYIITYYNIIVWNRK